MKTLPIAVLCGATLVFTGCDTTTGQGAGQGAAAGAIIGGIAGGNVRSAAIGAGAGALAGAVIGRMVEDERNQTAAVGRHPDLGIPVATPSQHRGFVISPFRPNALVDVRGIPRGARVMDPTSRQIFINP